MIEKWHELVFSYLKSDKSFQEYRIILLKMKEEGMTSEDALQIFEEIRKLKSEENEKDEDRILEVMDIIVGYCSPHLRVW